MKFVNIKLGSQFFYIILILSSKQTVLLFNLDINRIKKNKIMNHILNISNVDQVKWGNKTWLKKDLRHFKCSQNTRYCSKHCVLLKWNGILKIQLEISIGKSQTEYQSSLHESHGFSWILKSYTCIKLNFYTSKSTDNAHLWVSICLLKSTVIDCGKWFVPFPLAEISNKIFKLSLLLMFHCKSQTSSNLKTMGKNFN